MHNLSNDYLTSLVYRWKYKQTWDKSQQNGGIKGLFKEGRAFTAVCTLEQRRATKCTLHLMIIESYSLKGKNWYSHHWTGLSRLGIQVWNSRNDFIMEALSIICRNKHWSKSFIKFWFHPLVISQYARPLWRRLLWTLEQLAPQRPGILWDNQLMKSKFD